ncbi:MAG: hypothetical protein FWE90_00620 [Defluviitaleaceae bacterium]|nr:hypothetical protein [Defluviitaleaceae bacterium]
MRKQDIFGVLENAAKAIIKLQIGDNRVCKNERTETERKAELAKLETQYAAAEQELIDFIRKTSKQVFTVENLLVFFKDSCNAFNGLGIRFDALKERIVGTKPKSPQANFECAIYSGTVYNRHYHDCDDLFRSLTENSAHSLVQESFQESIDINSEMKSLAAVYLMQYLTEIGRKTGTTSIENALMCVSHTQHLTEPTWAERSLLGFFEDEDDVGFNEFLIHGRYRIETNKDFVRVFTNKITELFYNTRVDDKDYFAIQRLRNAVYTLAVSTYFGVLNENEPTYAFEEAMNAIRIIGNGSVSENSLCEEEQYYGDAIVLRRSDMCGTSYTMNAQGLKSFCEMIYHLKLDDMQGFSIVSDAIHSLA